MKCECGGKLKRKEYGTVVAVQAHEAVTDLYITIEFSCDKTDCANKYTATLSGPMSLCRVLP